MRSRHILTALACGAVTWLLLLSHYLDNAHHAATVTQRRQDLLLRRAAVDARRTNAADMLSKTHIWPCGVAPWSLRHQLDECEVGATALRIYYGYRALPYANSWNGFPLVEKLLLAAGFEERPMIAARSYHSHVGTHAVLVNGSVAEAPAVLVVPNYWKPGAENWRTWRLAPSQRINRVWGMMALAVKDSLVDTLRAHTELTGRLLLPRSYIWSELRRTPAGAAWWRTRAAGCSRRRRRGQGLRLVTSQELLAGGDSGGVGASLAGLLRGKSTVLQQYISDPLLVNGHKFSLRLYALVTCAAPLRVYLHGDGFALFASDVYDAGSLERYSFITNAFVNRKRTGAEDGAGAGGDDSRVAAELGLALPPASQRWGLTRLLSFVSKRHGAEGLGVRRALERLVLHVFVAAAAPLACAAAVGLPAGGVRATLIGRRVRARGVRCAARRRPVAVADGDQHDAVALARGRRRRGVEHQDGDAQRSPLPRRRSARAADRVAPPAAGGEARGADARQRARRRRRLRAALARRRLRPLPALGRGGRAPARRREAPRRQAVQLSPSADAECWRCAAAPTRPSRATPSRAAEDAAPPRSVGGAFVLNLVGRGVRRGALGRAALRRVGRSGQNFCFSIRYGATIFTCRLRSRLSAAASSAGRGSARLPTRRSGLSASRPFCSTSVPSAASSAATSRVPSSKAPSERLRDRAHLRVLDDLLHRREVELGQLPQPHALAPRRHLHAGREARAQRAAPRHRAAEERSTRRRGGRGRRQLGGDRFGARGGVGGRVRIHQ